MFEMRVGILRKLGQILVFTAYTRQSEFFSLLIVNLVALDCMPRHFDGV